MAVPSEMRKLVADRAGDRCEYCGLSQVGQEATFHVDHVVPVVAEGPTHPDNLALACVSCSLRKGAREVAVDPESGATARLFHPRKDDWKSHFEWSALQVIGRTAVGRATVAALQLNRPMLLAIRREEAHWKRHPHS